MSVYLSFLPILLFVIIYVGTGTYCSITGIENAFYQISPTVAIIPAIVLGIFMYQGTKEQKFQAFVDGVRHKDIIMMCIVFILAGAFSSVTTAIGSIDTTVNLALNLVPPRFLLIGLFITSAFISTAVGTSMGTIATIAPIAAGLINQDVFPAGLAMGTIVGGAMFGDNLSLISDTTIASVMSQEADLKKKWLLNVKLATFAFIITVFILYFAHSSEVNIVAKEYSLILVLPYIFLIVLALTGINVFAVLLAAIIFAGMVGLLYQNYGFFAFCKDVSKGFASMHEIMLLSLLVGGLSGLAGGSRKQLADDLGKWISAQESKRIAQLLIAKIVSIFDLLLANNTVAIVFSGEIAKDIARKHKIPSHYSAVWLDNFSCVFQGLIPYGAQILLASTIAGISPLEITPYVFYCFALLLVSLLYILLKKKLV